MLLLGIRRGIQCGHAKRSFMISGGRDGPDIAAL